MFVEEPQFRENQGELKHISTISHKPPFLEMCVQSCMKIANIMTMSEKWNDLLTVDVNAT